MAREKPRAAAGSAAKLGEFLCFAIYSANLAFCRAYKPLLDKLGLTYPQYLVLAALYEQDDQTVGGLGDKLFLDSSTLTPLLKRMESAGFLIRKRDPLDERQVRIHLTQRGRSAREKGFGFLDGLVEATGLAPGAHRQLLETMVKLRENLSHEAPKSAVVLRDR